MEWGSSRPGREYRFRKVPDGEDVTTFHVGFCSGLKMGRVFHLMAMGDGERRVLLSPSLAA